MANYVGTARTNYFRVSDPAAFAAFLAKWGLQQLDGANGRVGFTTSDWSDGGWPSEPTPEWGEVQEPPLACDEYAGPELVADLAGLLVPGEVAVGLEVGSEKLCYLVSDAWAVNATGETRSLSLEEEIMRRAGELGQVVTDPTY